MTHTPDPHRPHVRIARLGLRDYRNYASLDLRLDGRHVCLFGANGSGKTNLIEAVSLLSPGRGLRGAEFSDLVRNAPEGGAGRGWAISADAREGEIDRRISLALDIDDQGRARRSARLDGVETAQQDLGELMRIIWLTPAMDRVFTGPAGDRRRFLDRQVLAHFPSHAAAAAAYDKSMRQRNALLERGQGRGGPDPAWLEAIELGMASAGAAMAVHRVDAVRVMQEAILARPEGAFPKALVGIDGEFETQAANGVALTDIEQDILAQLRENRSRDAAAGRIDPETVDERLLASRLDTAGMPDPDLLIRTAGEMRLSNFLLWQISYAELWVTDVPWPEFTVAHLDAALADFAGRDRRFGGLTRP